MTRSFWISMVTSGELLVMLPYREPFSVFRDSAFLLLASGFGFAARIVWAALQIVLCLLR